MFRGNVTQPKICFKESSFEGLNWTGLV